MDGKIAFEIGWQYTLNYNFEDALEMLLLSATKLYPASFLSLEFCLKNIDIGNFNNEDEELTKLFRKKYDFNLRQYMYSYLLGTFYEYQKKEDDMLKYYILATKNEPIPEIIKRTIDRLMIYDKTNKTNLLEKYGRVTNIETILFHEYNLMFI